jgi:peptide/nickel transport system permease protein
VLKLTGRRLLAAIPILFLVLLMSFTLVELMPGNPAETLAGDAATPAQVDAIAQKLNLNEPILQRFVDYVGNVAQGDFGKSLFTSRPVMDEIMEALPITLSLILVALVMALLMAIPAGMYAATHRDGKVDRAVTLLSAIFVAVPQFVLAFFLVVFLAVNRHWFPPTGYQSIADGGLWGWLQHLILPAFALSLGTAAELARQVRGSMIDSLEEDYIRTARAMGLSTKSVVWKHALKNAAIPVVTVLGLQAGRLLGGAVIIEAVFALPGFGSLAYNAVFQQDIPVIQGVVVVSAVVIVVVNLLTDLSYTYFNPKLRH